MTDILVKGENVGVDTHREDKDRGDGFTGQGRPKTVQASRGWRSGQEQILPQSPQKEPTLLSP